MAIVCPTVTAFDTDQYKAQTELIAGFAKRMHIDLMDGEFAPTSSPALKDLWPIEGMVVDLHVMYQRPMDHLEEMLALKPHMVVWHVEADVDHAAFAAALHAAGVKAGIALLQKTPFSEAEHLLHDCDHLLVFSGNLGYHGGSAVDFSLLSKAKDALSAKPGIEIGWDGGISDENAVQLVRGGVEVLNTGGFIHKSPDPAGAFARLQNMVR
ncbi:MAG TPA: hypothetical protein VLF40_05580 [Candidatus Saccharimonadales bacterium]|nr:hypothetical protein [Candidatus Saccharimonadales bacterium]